jgi:hypothetical protein
MKDESDESVYACSQQTADSVVKVESLGSKILTHGPDSSVGRGPWTYLLQNPKNNHYSVVKDLKL